MNKGDKYIIEIAEVQEYHDDNGNVFQLGRVKGFKALTLDESALKKLEKVEKHEWKSMSERIYEETNSGKIIPKEKLVRCRECKHSDEPTCGRPRYCNWWGSSVDDNDFCSFGKEKEHE